MKTKRFFSKLFLAILCPLLICYAQEFIWASGVKGSARPYHIATDTQGNSYIAGQFYGSISFTDSLTLYGRGSQDIFIAKYAADGSFLWGRSAGGGGWDSGEGIGVDEEGNIYVTGYFEENGIFENDTIQSTSFYYWDVFLAKYNSEGALMWVRQAGGTDDDCGAALTVKNGNIYIAGTIIRMAFFDDDTLYCGYDVWSEDIFVACYSPGGDCMWAKLGAGDKRDYVNDIHADPNGDIYITGTFTSGTLTFGSTDIFRSAGSMYVAKFNPNGDLDWARANGTSSYVHGQGVAADANGNYYVTGYYTGAVSFDSTALSNYGDYEDFFLTRFDPEGNCCWAKHAGSFYYDYGYDVEIGKNGKIYAAGRAHKNSYFDQIFYNSLGGTDIALACYDTLGHCEWVLRGGGKYGDEYGRALSITQDGKIYVTGEAGVHATFPVTFGSTNLYNISGAVACASIFSEHAAVLADPELTLLGVDSAVISVGITDPGYPALSSHGFIWSPDKDPVFEDSCLDLGALSAPKTSVAVLRDLLPAREYRARAYAINAVDTVYSLILKFTTLGYANFSYLSVSEIDTASALLSAVMNLPGNPTPSDHGFCWNSSGNPVKEDAHVSLGARDSAGAFQSQISGLDPNTRYYVRAYAVNSLGTSYSDEMEFSTLESGIKSIPLHFYVKQNYPNPFNPLTRIAYGLPRPADVCIRIFDVRGNMLREWDLGFREAGHYAVDLEGSDRFGNALPSGVYLYSIDAGDFRDTRKMLLMK